MSRCGQYVGSFAVDDVCLDEQTVQLHTQLEALMVSLEPCKVGSGSSLRTEVKLTLALAQTCWRRRRRRPVSIRFSIKGVKIYDEDERVSLGSARF